MSSGNEKYRIVVPADKDTSVLQCMLSADYKTLIVATPAGYGSDVRIIFAGKIIGRSPDLGSEFNIHVLSLTTALVGGDFIEIYVEPGSTPTPPATAPYNEGWRIVEVSDSDPVVPVTPVTNNSSVNLAVKVVSINAINTGAIGNIPNFHNGIYRGAGYIYRGIGF